jgi:hypothetical protein
MKKQPLKKVTRVVKTNLGKEKIDDNMCVTG